MRPILSRLAPACLLLGLFACAAPPDGAVGPAGAVNAPTTAPRSVPPVAGSPCFDDAQPVPARLTSCASVIADSTAPLDRRTLALVMRGNLQDDSGQYDAALASYAEALRLDPNSYHAYYNRGLAHKRQKRFQLALTDFGQALRIDPHAARPYFHRCETYVALGDHRQAIRECGIVANSTGLPPAVRAFALTHVGNAQDESGQFEAALASYSEAINLNPAVPDGYYNRGVAYSRRHRYQEALSDLDAAIRLNPRHVSALINRCNVFRHLMQGARAVADCDAALAIDPDNAMAFANRAMARFIAGRPESEWMADYQAAARRDPEMARMLAPILNAPQGAAVAPATPEAMPRQPFNLPGGGSVMAKGMTVRLPEGAAWSGGVVALPYGGRLTELERDLPNGARAQVHVADYVSPEGEASMNTVMGVGGAGDAERLSRWLISVRDRLLAAGKGSSEWVNLNRAPQRAGAACQELHQTRDEPGTDGVDYRWRDWMLICIDPVSRMPVQADYAERYRADGAGPGPDFERRAGAFFDAITFGAGR